MSHSPPPPLPTSTSTTSAASLPSFTPTTPLPTLNALSLSSWAANAPFWDAHMGRSGNEFFNVLEMPAVERLVAVRPGDRVLDLATGNGLLARRLQAKGAMVWATDGCGEMVGLAGGWGKGVERDGENREKGEGIGERRDGGERIIYSVLDVTKKEDFERMIEEGKKHGGFDTVTMNMAIMDVPTLEPLTAALPQLLKKDGKFVASICHPVFFSPGASRHIEVGENPLTGRLEASHSMKIARYMDIPPSRGEAIPEQPAVQLYFHRSMQEVFRPFFAQGMRLDGLEEVAFAVGPNKGKLQSYHNYPQIPPILVFRMRV